jgi:membrane protein insertase Oxa1/YidC/SpoIIIJ
LLLSLPKVLTASTFLLTVELGTDGVNPQQKAQMKTIFRILAAAMIPITASFPAVGGAFPP